MFVPARAGRPASARLAPGSHWLGVDRAGPAPNELLLADPSVEGREVVLTLPVGALVLCHADLAVLPGSGGPLLWFGATRCSEPAFAPGAAPRQPRRRRGSGRWPVPWAGRWPSGTAAAQVGFDRIAALHYHSSTLYHT
jgi:hypothetical protein